MAMGCQIAPSWNEVFNARLISAFSSDNDLFWNFDILISDYCRKATSQQKTKGTMKAKQIKAIIPTFVGGQTKMVFTCSQRSARGPCSHSFSSVADCGFSASASTSNERRTSWEYTLIVCFFESLGRADSGRNVKRTPNTGITKKDNQSCW